MRLSHKRNILLKQNKKLRLTKEETSAEKGKEKSAKALAKEAARNAAPKTKKSAPAKKEAVKANSTKKETATKKTAAKTTTTKTTAAKTIDTSSVNLTPKQQTILDIIAKASTALSAKEIGVEAGQDEAKASAWATSGLKKLVDENLVVKLSDGNKSSYSIA